MVLSFVPITVFAAGGDKTVSLGTDVIKNPTAPTASTDTWKGSYVYFGTYGGNPVKYRVLDKNTTVFGGTTMLLDCDSILWAGRNPSSAFDDNSNDWANSNIRTYLNGTFLTSNFSTAEQNAIAQAPRVPNTAQMEMDGLVLYPMLHLAMIKFSSLMQRKQPIQVMDTVIMLVVQQTEKKQAATPFGGCGRLILSMPTTPAWSIRAAASARVSSASMLV